MTPEQVIAKIRTIRETNPGNLMARHFNEDYFRARLPVSQALTSDKRRFALLPSLPPEAELGQRD